MIVKKSENIDHAIGFIVFFFWYLFLCLSTFLLQRIGILFAPMKIICLKWFKNTIKL